MSSDTGPDGRPAGFADGERRLASAALTAWRISAALMAGPPLAVGAIVAVVLLDRWAWVTVAAAILAFVVVVGWLQSLRHARWRWQLTDQTLNLRHGVLTHVQESVPYFRIQQIDLAQGPVDRLLGLSTMQVTTASASGSVTIPGIRAEDAPAIRIELLRRTSEAVSRHPGDVRDAV